MNFSYSASSSAAPAPATATFRPGAAPALKEWAVVCDLLLQGRLSVLFRKGGIDEKGFWVEANEFLLFPTYFHQNREKVREEFLGDFDRAMAAAPPEGVLRVPALARVHAAVEVRRPERVRELEDLHVYTEDQIAMRLEFRPRKPLVLLVVEVRPVAPPVDLPMLEAYAGCLSWVSLDAPAYSAGEPVQPRHRLDGVADRVKDVVG